jgi:hypothetical protein
MVGFNGQILVHTIESLYNISVTEISVSRSFKLPMIWASINLLSFILVPIGLPRPPTKAPKSQLKNLAVEDQPQTEHDHRQSNQV